MKYLKKFNKLTEKLNIHVKSEERFYLNEEFLNAIEDICYDLTDDYYVKIDIFSSKSRIAMSNYETDYDKPREGLEYPCIRILLEDNDYIEDGYYVRKSHDDKCINTLIDVSNRIKDYIDESFVLFGVGFYNRKKSFKQNYYYSETIKKSKRDISYIEIIFDTSKL